VPGQAVKLVVACRAGGGSAGRLARRPRADGQWRPVVPLEAAAPHRTTHSAASTSSSSARAGEYLALLTVREREGADPPLRVAVARLLASDSPIVRLDVEPMIGRGESFRLTLRAGAVEGGAATCS